MLINLPNLQEIFIVYQCMYAFRNAPINCLPITVKLSSPITIACNNKNPWFFPRTSMILKQVSGMYFHFADTQCQSHLCTYRLLCKLRNCHLSIIFDIILKFHTLFSREPCPITWDGKSRRQLLCLVPLPNLIFWFYYKCSK